MSKTELVKILPRNFTKPCYNVNDMRYRALLMVGLAGIAGVASAQKLIFNFEAMNVSSRPIHTSPGGFALLEQSFNKYQIWNKQTGAHSLQDAYATEIIRKVTSDGSVYGKQGYGLIGYKLVKWDANGNKSVLGNLSESMKLVDVRPNGKLLLSDQETVSELYGSSGRRDTQWSTLYEFDAATGTTNKIADRSRFTPESYGPGGRVLGREGSYTISDQYSYAYNGGRWKSLFPSQEFEDAGSSSYYQYQRTNMRMLGDQSRIVTTESSVSTSSSERSETFISTTGEALTFSYEGYGGITNRKFSTYASGRLAFGYARLNLDPIKPIYQVGNETYDLDASSFAPGSEIANWFMEDNFSDSGYVLATKGDSNSFQYLIGTYRSVVPEPVTLATLGLGSLALLRKRRKNS